MTRTSRPDPDPLDRILHEQLGVIARHQAPAAGITASALRHRLRPGGPWRTLLPGIYLAATGTPAPLQREMAALLYAGGSSMITGMAALRCHHIATAMPDLIDVLVSPARQRHDAGFVRLHRTARMPDRMWERGPIRYAPPARAVADTARGMTSLRDVRAVVAGAVQRRACQVRDLAAELAAGPSTGSALFREALADVAEGIRSVAEADLKDLLVKAKIPMPLFNPALYGKDGTFIAQPDAWWPELGIAIEVDSREWHLSPEDHEKTLTRGRRMGRYQIIVMRFTPRQLRSEAATVVEEIRRTLEGARGRPPLNLRTVPAEESGQGPGPRTAAVA
jgi:hypothetical protein